MKDNATGSANRESFFLFPASSALRLLIDCNYFRSTVPARPLMANHSVSTKTDEELMVEYQRGGDRAVFELLMRRYEIEIYSYLRRYLGNAELAEDAFQSVFLQVHLKCEQFDPSRRFRPWLYAIATNQAIDLQRRNRRHNMASLDRTAVRGEDEGHWSDKLIGEAPDPFLEATLQENAQWVHQTVGKLSEPMRQVIELVYYQGMKYREAADVLGVPVGTVKSRLHACVQRLGQEWEDTHSTASGNPFA